MKTTTYAEAPEKFRTLIDRARGDAAVDLPSPPPSSEAAPRPFRAHFVPELGHEVHVTFADLNDSLFIAEHTPQAGNDAARQMQGLLLQVVACTYRAPEHLPQFRMWRVDRAQDDRPYLRGLLSVETLVDIAGISSALGRRREYVSPGVRDFLSATQTCLSELSGLLSTSTDCPPRLKETLSALTSAARQLTSPASSASGTASSAGG